MSARYEYDLDHNGEWRWIAIAEGGQVSAVSPAGYRNLQDCMHAVGLLRDPGGFAVLRLVRPELTPAVFLHLR